MPSERVAFRAVAPLDRELGARSDNPDGPLGTVVQAELGRWFRFLAVQLSTVRLSREQALYLCDVLNGVLVDDSWLRDPGQLLAAEVEDAAIDGLGEKWGVDPAVLAAMCAGWHPAQAMAVLDAVARFWRADSAETDVDDRLAAVGLIRRASVL